MNKQITKLEASNRLELAQLLIEQRRYQDAVFAIVGQEFRDLPVDDPQIQLEILRIKRLAGWK